MTELKTKATEVSVDKFIKSVPDKVKREDSYKLIDIMKKITKEEPVMPYFSLRFAVIQLLILFYAAYSQSDSSEVFKLPELKIYDNVKKKDANFHFEEKINLFILKESSLVADTNKFSYLVDIEKIHKIAFRNGTNFRGGAAYGAAFGFVLGFFAGGYFTIDGPVKFNLANAFAGAAVFAIPFAGIGGLIGLLSPKFDEYEFTGGDNELRHEKLYRILKKNRIKSVKN